LEGRPVNDFLPVLLDAFRNPWPAAADHAADTLITLGAADAVGPLIARLDEPSPSAPVDNEKGESVVHELVRVNHARNCLLCHAQSVSRSGRRSCRGAEADPAVASAILAQHI
jgi:hypothetical protein